MSHDRFDKNSVVGAVFMPFPLTDLSKDASALPSLLVPRIKMDPDQDNLYELKVRHCINVKHPVVRCDDVHAHVG